MAYNYTNIAKIFSNVGSRNDVRKRVIDEFSKENFGIGKNHNASRYCYIVGQCENNNQIMLKRPAPLKAGFDFKIEVSGINFNPSGRRNSAPKHDNIIDDLNLKKSNNAQVYSEIYQEIHKIFNCQIEVEDININLFNSIKVGLDIDIVLHVIKWFFIEQDIRYWNYSGRNMFFEGIPIP